MILQEVLDAMYRAVESCTSIEPKLTIFIGRKTYQTILPYCHDSKLYGADLYVVDTDTYCKVIAE